MPNGIEAQCTFGTCWIHVQLNDSHPQNTYTWTDECNELLQMVTKWLETRRSGLSTCSDSDNDLDTFRSFVVQTQAEIQF